MREFIPNLSGNAIVHSLILESALVLTPFRSLVLHFCTHWAYPFLPPKWFNPEPTIGWAVEDESIVASG